MSRLLLAALALQSVLSGAVFNPGDQLITTFTAVPNTSDMLLFFTNDPLTVTGSPVLTTKLYNGQTLLGTYVASPFVYNGVAYFETGFVPQGSGVSVVSASGVDFTSLNDGTINGRLVTTIAGGSISGFSLSDFVLYDAHSLPNGYRPLGDVTRTSLVLQGPSILPHLPSGDTWTTGITIINTATQAASFSIAFHDDLGKPTTLPFAAGALTTLAGTLPALGSSYFEAANPTGSLAVAWGQVTADPSIVVQALLRNNANGTYYEAAVPPSSPAKEFEVPFDATTFQPTGAPIYTGLAVANLDPSDRANITCTARDAAGTVVPNAVVVPALAPLGHWANYLFPALSGLRGTIDCTSDSTVSAIALRFVGSTAFSTLPVVLK